MVFALNEQQFQTTMDYSEKALWQVIDGDVTPTQHAAFQDACKRSPVLSDRYSRLLKMHNQLRAYFATSGSAVREKGSPPPAITPLRQQDQQLH